MTDLLKNSPQPLAPNTQNDQADEARTAANQIDLTSGSLPAPIKQEPRVWKSLEARFLNKFDINEVDASQIIDLISDDEVEIVTPKNTNQGGENDFQVVSSNGENHYQPLANKDDDGLEIVNPKRVETPPLKPVENGHVPEDDPMEDLFGPEPLPRLETPPREVLVLDDEPQALPGLETHQPAVAVQPDVVILDNDPVQEPQHEQVPPPEQPHTEAEKPRAVTEEADLFVRQRGVPQEVNGCIDLTNEDDEDTHLRLLRLKTQADAQGERIKEEDAPPAPPPLAPPPVVTPSAAGVRSHTSRHDFTGRDVASSDAGSDADYETGVESLSDGERPRKRARRSKATRRTKGKAQVLSEKEENDAWKRLERELALQSDLQETGKARILTALEKLQWLQISANITALTEKLGFKAQAMESMPAPALRAHEPLYGGAPAQSRSPSIQWPSPVLRAASSIQHPAQSPRATPGFQLPSPISLGPPSAQSSTPARSLPSPAIQRPPQAAPTLPDSIETTSSRKIIKTAKQYWEQKYAEAKVKGYDAQLLIKSSQVTLNAEVSRGKDAGPSKKNKRKAPENNPQQTESLLRMLREEDPVTARAAMGNMPLPGAIVARNKGDQWKQIVHQIAQNPSGEKDAKADIDYDKKMLAEATKSFGYRKCRADQGKWRLAGMKTSLFHHQLVGTRWMLGQEFSPEGPYGGILADQMGLGKTLQILATMTHNPPVEGDDERKITLLIVPATTIKQWQEEIQKHTNFSSVHYQASRYKGIDASAWRRYDIVIVSYQEVAKAHPSDDTLKKLASMKLNNEEWGHEFDRVLGDLFRTKFRRVVLDEAHAIKNYHSRTSKACVALNSTYRWALTGTPIQNSIDELFPYMRFIGADWAAGNIDSFRKQFGNIEDDTTQQRLAAFVRSVILRRRVSDKFLGQPILQIPMTHPPEILAIDFSKEERLLYSRLESRFRDNMSQHIENGTEGKKTRTYLAYLSRLRQAVCHPFLMELSIAVDFTLEDMHWIKRELEQYGRGQPFFRQLQNWVTLSYENEPGYRKEDADKAVFGRGRFGYEFNMRRQLAAATAVKTMKEVICRFCFDNPASPQMTECGHAFCEECILMVVESADILNAQAKCPTCHRPFVITEDLKEPEPLEEDVNMPDAPPGTRRRRTAEKAQRDPGDDFLWTQPSAPVVSKWLNMSDSRPEIPLTPSAKTTAVKSKVLQWQKEAPNDKIIIFTQWVLMGRLIGRILESEGIQFLYYFGSMSATQRHAAIKAFHEQRGVKVLIASTKCGGQALNLTCANRVILTDLWWNTSVERQAFGRVHRIGQAKETYFCKIVVRNTIDERLLDMQEEKDAFINRTLNDDMRNTRNNITLKDLQTLFRQPGEDASELEDSDVVPHAGESTEDTQAARDKGKGKEKAQDKGKEKRQPGQKRKKRRRAWMKGLEGLGLSDASDDSLSPGSDMDGHGDDEENDDEVDRDNVRINTSNGEASGTQDPVD